MENGVAKEYVWQSHPQIRKRIENFGKGLIELGLKRQQALGIYAVNKPEWVSLIFFFFFDVFYCLPPFFFIKTMAELASYRQAFMIVALYDTLGAEAMEYIVNQVDMEVIVLSADKLDNISKLKAQLPSIKTIIVMEDTISPASKEAAEAVDFKVLTFCEVEALGAPITEETEVSKPDDIATICYTR